MKRPRRGFTLIELMIVIAIIAILTTILLPNFVRARSQGRITACKTNLKSLATACETYSTDNASRYPTNLTVLTPQFIQSIPTCPSANVNTNYITGFQSTSSPDSYTVMCTGTFHGELGMSANFPQYQSATGLIEH